MEDLNDLLTEVLEQHDVPSLAAAVVFGDEVHAAGAVGVRKRGDDTPVTINDKYHIGSCTKAMTATLAGVLVERGLLSWETTLREVFPEMDIHRDYQPMTLEKLLTHTAGFPANPHDALWEEIWEAKGLPQEQRSALVLPGLLKQSPDHEAAEFMYSNAGYTVAGAMLERVAGESFELLLEREYFQPLEMVSAGFGAPATLGIIDQPYGHDPDPVDPEPYGDNPPAISPAGTVHMSVPDFAKHAIFHLTGTPKLVSQETLKLLHTPAKKDYALGWYVSERPKTGGIWATHTGSNTMFQAFVGFDVARNKAVVYATNLGTKEGVDACVRLFPLIAKRYLQ